MISTSYHKDKTDIVIFSLSRWDAVISSPSVALAKEFSNRHRVFFIEHPYSFRDFLKERKSSQVYHIGNITVVTPPLVCPVNFIPEGKFYDLFSGLNNSIITRTLKNLIRRYNIRQYIFINSFDPFYLQTIPGKIRPVKYVYQCMDDLSQVEYTRRHGVRLEKEVIKNADVVLCTSVELTRLKSEISGNVHFHPNAADFALFNKAATFNFPRPDNMHFGDKKIIGFMGSIEYRTDFELLRKIALHHNDKILFLVGPVSGDEHIRAGLDQLSNVVFAGAQNITALPQYLHHFDCCIIPYKINTLTASIYPLKINEYLAAGKPVVSTHFSEDIFSFREYIYVVESHEAFNDAIDRAIMENNQGKAEQRIRVAASNTWKQRVEEFWNLIT